MAGSTADRGVSAGDYEYRVATRADEPAVRALLASISTEGTVRLSFRREPDAYGAGFGARSQDFIIAHDRRTGACVGLCERVVRECFVNGEIRALPYLAGLRVAPGFRHRLRVLRGGFEAVRKLGAPGDLPYAYTSIMGDNMIARRVLGARLPGMPRYEPVGEYSTFALPAGGRADCERANAADLPEIAQRLHAAGVRRQFAAAWSLTHLREFVSAGWLRAEDFFVIRREGRIRACAALWATSRWRQVVIAGYAPWLARTRPLVNVAATLLGQPRLPAPGAPLRCAWLSPFAVEEDAATDLQVLAHAARAQARERGLAVVFAGCAATERVADTLRALPRVREYRSSLFVVRWPDDPPAALDGRVVSPDLALL